MFSDDDDGDCGEVVAVDMISYCWCGECRLRRSDVVCDGANAMVCVENRAMAAEAWATRRLVMVVCSVWWCRLSSISIIGW